MNKTNYVGSAAFQPMGWRSYDSPTGTPDGIRGLNLYWSYEPDIQDAKAVRHP